VKIALTTASLLLVAGGAVACGGDDDGGSAADDTSASASATAPGAGSSDDASDDASDDTGGDDASTEAFCGAFKDFASSFFEVDTTDPAAVVQVLKEEADKLRQVGTPDDIPDSAEEGLGLVLDAIDGLPDDATLDDIEKIDQGFSEDDEAKADEFSQYLSDTCPDLEGDASDVPSPAESVTVPAPSAS